MNVETNMYDKEELFDDCVVEVLTNTITGEVSVGWWKKIGWKKLESKEDCPLDYEVIAYSSEHKKQMIGTVSWDDKCDCFICESSGDIMFDVTHWHIMILPPSD